MSLTNINCRLFFRTSRAAEARLPSSQCEVFNCYPLLPYIYNLTWWPEIILSHTHHKQEVKVETIFQCLHRAQGLKRTETNCKSLQEICPKKSRKEGDDHHHPDQSSLSVAEWLRTRLLQPCPAVLGSTCQPMLAALLSVLLAALLAALLAPLLTALLAALFSALLAALLTALFSVLLAPLLAPLLAAPLGSLPRT